MAKAYDRILEVIRELDEPFAVTDVAALADVSNETAGGTLYTWARSRIHVRQYRRGEYVRADSDIPLSPKDVRTLAAPKTDEVRKYLEDRIPYGLQFGFASVADGVGCDITYASAILVAMWRNNEIECVWSGKYMRVQPTSEPGPASATEHTFEIIDGNLSDKALVRHSENGKLYKLVPFVF